METCIHCNKQFDPSNVEIPSPILDRMCAHCGNVLTEEEIAVLIAQNEALKNI